MTKKRKMMFATAAAGIMMSSCTGPFTLTKRVHDFQTSFDDRWVDEVSFLGFVIFQVYTFSCLADAIVFNSVEFWTGDNPMDSVSTTPCEQDQQQAKVEKLTDGSYRITRGDEVLIMKKTETGVIATNEEGKVQFTSERDEQNNVVISNSDGEVTRVIPITLK